MRRRGVSLIEILVAGSLASLVLAIVATWFRFGSQQFQDTSTAAQFGRDMSLSIQNIRKDLNESSLHSVRSSVLGLSMATCRKEDGKVALTERGDIDWQGHCLYTIEPGSGKTGSLVRWVQDKELVYPQATAVLPQPLQGTRRKVVLRGVVRPAPKTDKKEEWPPFGEAEDLDPDYGGFQVSFVRSDGSLTHKNPVQLNTGAVADKPSGKSTGLVEVSLATASNLRRNQVNYLSLTFRTRPQR